MTPLYCSLRAVFIFSNIIKKSILTPPIDPITKPTNTPFALSVLVLTLLTSACTEQQVVNDDVQIRVRPKRPSAFLVVPHPPSFLPTPYAGTEFPPTTEENALYASYLQKTELFPDHRLCEHNLKIRIHGRSAEDSLRIDWVINPYLAWGGVRDKGAVVGPVHHLFSIMEAHVSFQNNSDQEVNATFSCYVQYASQHESKIWRKGFLKYGDGLSAGHRKYVSTPVSHFTSNFPGKPDAWETGVKYYKGG